MADVDRRGLLHVGLPRLRGGGVRPPLRVPRHLVRVPDLGLPRRRLRRAGPRLRPHAARLPRPAGLGPDRARPSQGRARAAAVGGGGLEKLGGEPLGEGGDDAALDVRGVPHEARERLPRDDEDACRLRRRDGRGAGGLRDEGDLA